MSNNTSTVAYTDWLEEVARQAMRSEWVINPDDDYWFPKYDRGLSPDDALEELWDELNNTRRNRR